MEDPASCHGCAQLFVPTSTSPAELAGLSDASTVKTWKTNAGWSICIGAALNFIHGRLHPSAPSAATRWLCWEQRARTMFPIPSQDGRLIVFIAFNHCYLPLPYQLSSRSEANAKPSNQTDFPSPTVGSILLLRSPQTRKNTRRQRCNFRCNVCVITHMNIDKNLQFSPATPTIWNTHFVTQAGQCAPTKILLAAPSCLRSDQQCVPATE